MARTLKWPAINMTRGTSGGRPSDSSSVTRHNPPAIKRNYYPKASDEVGGTTSLLNQMALSEGRQSNHKEANLAHVVLPDAIPPKLLTVEEAATILRRSRSKVYDMASKGTIPGIVRIDGGILVLAEVLYQWIRNQASGK
ncbi:MAG: helix-turn-helix domain-containing protein [Chloroflexota bacterium]|jgi:excisionase family DNA binding protein